MDPAQKKNASFPYNLDYSVADVFPNISKHQFLFVYSYTRLVELAVYLGIGPQIYADGLLVFQQQRDKQQEGGEKTSRGGIGNQKVIGRLSSKHILRYLLERGFSSQPLYGTTASEIMDPILTHQKLKIDSPIRKVIDIFRETKFAFVPILNKRDGMIEEEIAGVLSVRNFLPLFSKPAVSGSTRNTHTVANIETTEALSLTTREISSDLVSVKENASVREAIDIMIKRQIRNIGVKDEDYNLVGLLNDRIVLEFLLRHMRTKDGSSRGIIDPANNIQHAYYKKDNISSDSISSTNNDVSNMDIKNNLRTVPLSEATVVDGNITVGQASELLMDIHDPYLIIKSENAIVTPWDIVMKTITILIK